MPDAVKSNEWLKAPNKPSCLTPSIAAWVKE
jgi:hypothetical protein